MNAPFDPTDTPEIKALAEVHAAAKSAAKDAWTAFWDAARTARLGALGEAGIVLNETPVTLWSMQHNGLGNPPTMRPEGRAGAYVVTGATGEGYQVAKLTKSGAPSKSGSGIYRTIIAVTKSEGGAA